MNHCYWRLTASLLLSVSLAHADSREISAQTQTFTTQFQAYAEVEPVAMLPLRAAQAGIVSGIKVLPGDSLIAGQVLGRLSGPEVQALSSQTTTALSNARIQLAAARKTLKLQQQQLKLQLTTRLTVLQAESAVAQAESVFETATSQQQAVQQAITITAPADSLVLAIQAANGERVSAGQTILTLQATAGLWLKAVYYGSDVSAIQAGMSGEFTPADGSSAIPVKVATVFAKLTPDGGDSVGLLASNPTSGWRNGEFGTVTLNGPSRSLVAIPTRALILDQGQWWVLVHTANGDQPQLVTPGPSRGWQTFIEKGLAPGTVVVVENAYLEFHRSISQHFQPPD